MNDLVVDSMDKLIDISLKLKQKDEKSKIHLWFRGQPEYTMKLIPSVQRINCKDLDILENNLCNSFYRRAKPVIAAAPVKEDYAAWLSLMQHYGLATRLLDWSSSPLIAMYFAVCDDNHKDDDGCLWALSPRRLNNVEGFGNFVFPVDSETVHRMLKPAYKQQDNKELTEEERIGGKLESYNKIIACHSIENDLRMYSQQAHFTVHNSRRTLEEICDSDTLFKIRIPKEKKEYFINILEICGITESFIYPDFEHISRDIRKTYILKEF